MSSKSRCGSSPASTRSALWARLPASWGTQPRVRKWPPTAAPSTHATPRTSHHGGLHRDRVSCTPHKLQANPRGAKLHAVPERKATVKRYLFLGLLLAPAIGCGGGQTRTSGAARGDPLSERQRDSILAQSRIPGATGVGKAMRVADSTSARVRAADSVAP